MPCPLKIYFTNKVNTICGGVQLLVTGSQGLFTRVPGVRIPCPRVPVPESQGPKSQGPRVSGLGSQVLILDHAMVDVSEFSLQQIPFSAKSSMYWRQSRRFLSRTPLKTGVKPKKQPLQLSFKKRCSKKFCKFYRKTPVLKSLFNRVAGQETQTQMFSCGTYEIFKNLRTAASETCCFTWSVLFNKFRFGSN